MFLSKQWLISTLLFTQLVLQGTTGQSDPVPAVPVPPNSQGESEPDTLSGVDSLVGNDDTLLAQEFRILQVTPESLQGLNQSRIYVNTSMTELEVLSARLRVEGVLPPCRYSSPNNMRADLLCRCALTYANAPLYDIVYDNKSFADFVPSFYINHDKAHSACVTSFGLVCGICGQGMMCVGQRDDDDTGLCVPCRSSNYCPNGTANPIFYARANRTPGGHYSPDPSSLLDCPEGSYCLHGSVEPKTCEDATRDKGFYCAPLSVRNTTECPGGSLCPNTSTIRTCPEGMYCIEGSSSGRKCPDFSKCPRGAEKPSISIAGFVVAIFFCLIASFPMCMVSRRWRKEQEKQSSAAQTHTVVSHVTSRLCYEALDMPSLSSSFSGFRQKKHRMAIDFQNVKLWLTSGKVILEDVTGKFKEGTLNAIMGPSGCGKTSLLNVLTCKAQYGIVDGLVTLNGQVVSRRAYKRIMGFVPQDDTVFGDLTVRENLRYSALLRLPAKTRMSRVNAIVDDVVSVLQLLHIQNSIVGSVEKRGISGGQRKRVNIGMELVSDPSLLFLDEPTTGLDASSSEDIISALKEMCTRVGCTTVMVIHQPRYSIFSLFDNVLLLGAGGRVCYLGSPLQASTYFGSHGYECPELENPADFFMDVIAGRVASKLEQDQDTVPNIAERKPLPLLWQEHITERRATAANGASSLDNRATLQSSVSSLSQTKGIEFFRKCASSEDGSIRSDEFRSMLVHRGYCSVEDSHLATKQIMKEIGANKTGRFQPETLVSYLCRDTELTVCLAQQSDDEDDVSTSQNESTVARIFTKMKSQFVPGGWNSENPPLVEADARTATVVEATAASPNNLNLRRWSVAPWAAGRNLSLAGAVTPLDTKTGEKVLRLPKRRKPSWGRQFFWLLHRGSVQWWRDRKVKAINLMMLTICALLIGLLQGSGWGFRETAPKLLLAHLGLCLLSTVASLATFSNNWEMFQRETACGLRPSAYFFATLVIDLPDVVMRALVYGCVFYSATLPVMSLTEFWGVLALLSWATSGYGNLLSVILPRASAQTAAVVVTLILGAFFTGVSPTLPSLGPMKALCWFSPSRWSIEANTIRIAHEFAKDHKIEVFDRLESLGYYYDKFLGDTTVLIWLGICPRLLVLAVLWNTANPDVLVHPIRTGLRDGVALIRETFETLVLEALVAYHGVRRLL